MTSPTGGGSPQPPPAAWYADPHGAPGQTRWWDGTKWTEHVQAAPPPAQPLPTPATSPARPTAQSVRTTSAPAPHNTTMPTWGWWAIGAVVLIIVIAIASGGSSSTSPAPASNVAPVSNSAPPPASTAPSDTAAASDSGAASNDGAAAVAGELSKDCSIKCTSPDAAENLDSSDVWCSWKGPDVVVHAVLTNKMNANVKLSIVPKYFLEKGGQHGTSFGSDIPVELAAGERLDWTGNAGQPEGVAPGLAITACEPRLEDIDIG